MFRMSHLAAAVVALGLGLSAPAVLAQDDRDRALWHNEFDPNFSQQEQFDPAQIDKMAEEIHQVDLTEDMITRFIASYPEMKAVGKKFPDASAPEPGAEAEPGSTDADLKNMFGDKRAAMSAVATAHGFKDVDDWAAVGSSIAMSYTYALQGKQPGEVGKAIKVHISEVKEDAKLSDAEKAAQIEQLENLGEKLVRLEPTLANYELVLHMKTKVAPIMNFE
jgi:hypothetical protein